MDIGFYIADLLRSQDAVSLPGLGTFTKVRMAGSYDRMSNSFLPPSYQVAFKNTSEDQHSLTEYISNKKNLSESSSEYFVRKFTTALFELLQTSGIAEIKPLGIIRQKDKNLSFEASSNFNIAGNFYGLKPVNDREIVIPVAAATATIPVEEILRQDVVLDDEEQEEVEIEETSKSNLTTIVIAAIVLLIGTAVMLYLFYPPVKELISGKAATGVNNVQPVPAPAGTPVVIPDSAVNTAPDTAAEALTAESLIVKSPLEETPASVAEAVSFEIVTAAFARKSEAEEYIKQVGKKGFTGKIVNNIPGNRIKVSLGSFADEASAQAELSKIQKEVNKDAWIARIKPKKTK
jgi:cell division septation protein DedD